MKFSLAKNQAFYDCFGVLSAASRGQSSRHHSRAGGAASVQVAAVGGAWREGGVVWDERQR